MKLIKKKLLALKPDPIPAGWPAQAHCNQRLGMGASKRKYEGIWMFCCTWFDEKGSPFARLFLGHDSFITYLFKTDEWSYKLIHDTAMDGNGWVRLYRDYDVFVADGVLGLLKACGKKRSDVSENNPLHLIEDVQKRIQSKRVTPAERRREEAEEYDIDAMQPPPPEDLVQMVQDKGMLSAKYVLFRRRTKRATKTREQEVYYPCVCTHCGGEYTLPDDLHHDTPTHGGDSWCPMCGHSGGYLEQNRLRNPRTSKVCALVFHRVDDHILAIGYTLERSIDKNGRDSIAVIDDDAFLFVPGRAIRYSKWWGGYFGNKEPLNSWDYKDNVRVDSWKGSRYDMVYPLDPEMFAGTLLENAHLQLYLDQCAERNNVAFHTRYCDQFLRYPGIENLLVNHFFDILHEKVHGTSDANRAVKWRQCAPSKMLELNRAEQRRMKAEHWTGETLLAYKKMRREGWEMTADDLTMWCALKKIRISSMNLAAAVTTQLYRYLHKQHALHPDQTYTSIAGTWKDYHEAGVSLAYNFDDMAVLFPSKLGAAHDRAVEARQYAENPELIKKFADAHKKLAPLSWEQDGLCIRPAASERELIAEGRILSHCVGGYGKSHCTGRPIFFVRHASDPSLPYFTLQLNTTEKTIIQNRGYKNAMRTPEIEAFEAAWLTEIVAHFDVKKGKFTKKKATAAHPAA